MSYDNKTTVFDLSMAKQIRKITENIQTLYNGKINVTPIEVN